MSPISGVTWPDTLPTGALVRGPQSPIDARSHTERRLPRRAGQSPAAMTMAWLSATGSWRTSDVVRRVPRLPPCPSDADHDADHSIVTVTGNVSPLAAMADESR